MKKFVAGKNGELKEKPTPDVDLRDLDLGTSSKIRKNPKPAKITHSKVAPEATLDVKPRGAKRTSGVEVVEQYFTDLGVPEKLQMNYSGARLDASLLVDATDDAGNPIPAHFRFVSSMNMQPAKAKANGYTEVRINPKTRKLDSSGVPIAPIGDRKTGRSMQLMVQRLDHKLQRDEVRNRVLQEGRANKHKQVVDSGLELAKELGVRAEFEEAVIDRITESNITEL